MAGGSLGDCARAEKRLIHTRIGLLVILATSVLSGCRKGEAARGPSLEPAGSPLSSGAAADLRLTPDQKYATYLLEPQKPRLTGVPPLMVLGALYASSLEQKQARKLGDGVTNVPGGYLFSPDSRWVLFLIGYNASQQTGALHAAELGSNQRPIELGNAVSYFVVSPDSNWVALVDNGVLRVGRLASGPFRSLAGEVANAQFSPNSRWLVYRRKLAAGAALLLAELGSDRVWQVGGPVGDYLVAPDSHFVAFAQRSGPGQGGYDLFLANVGPEKLPPKRLARRSGFFAFSPDGRWLGWVQEMNQENAGDLYIGAVNGGAGRKIGAKVVDFSFAPDSSAVAYLDSYTDAARAGILAMTALPDGKTRRLGNRVPNFSWGADGKYLAFLSRFTKPVYSVDLMLYLAGEESAFKAHQGVFGYGFSPKNRFLFFRSNCIREGRACDLYQLDLANPKAEAKKILEGIYTFKSSDDEQRLLVTYARVDLEAFDVAVYNLKTMERRTLARQIQLPTYFAATDGSKVIYMVGERKNAGVFLADQVP